MFYDFWVNFFLFNCSSLIFSASSSAIVLRLAKDVLFKQKGALFGRTYETHILQIRYRPVKIISNVLIELIRSI